MASTVALARASRLLATAPTPLAARVLARRTASASASTIANAAAGEFKYVPGGPIVRGSPNDPTPFPPSSRTHGSHHWSFERLLSAALVPAIGGAFVVSAGGSAQALVDGALGLTLIVHSHIGFDALLVDYLHPRKWPLLGPLLTWTLRAMTVGAAAGVYAFNTGDIGLTELIARVWHA